MYTKLISEYRFDPSEDPASAVFDLMHYGYVCIVDENSNVVPEDSGTNESNTDTTADSSSNTTTDVDTAVEQSSTDLSLDIQ